MRVLLYSLLITATYGQKEDSNSSTLLIPYPEVVSTPINKAENTYECSTAFCQNGRLVASNHTTAICKCNEFYEGDCCEQRRCILGGYSVDGVCVCPPGQSGNYCEEVSCNGGRLAYHDGQHFCDCPPDRQGRFCEVERCRHGGSFNKDGCLCIAGYYGRRCEYINCNHGWRTLYADGYYRCKCSLLHEGHFCENYHIGVVCLICFSIAFAWVMALALGLFYCKGRVLRRNPRVKNVILRQHDYGSHGSSHPDADPLLARPTPPVRTSKLELNTSENPVKL